jgi:5'-3' exonuclease
VVQVDRKSGKIRDAQEVMAKFGVPPSSIADYLALVGDSADGYPGIRGFGPKTAADVIARFHHIEEMPDEILRDQKEAALLFKKLATLVVDAPLFESVDELAWQGPRPAFDAFAEKMQDSRIAARAHRALAKRSA